MSGRILEVEGIDVFYGASQILFGVSLAVEQGQSLALLGRNGAGKSTTMKAIIGLAPPRRGTVKVRGVAMQGRAADRVARAGIGYVPEDRQVFPEHSVEDNLLIGAKPGMGGRQDWTLARIWEVFPTLAGMRTRMAGRLSGGEQQMLTIARTLMGNPALLLLDEPSEGLARYPDCCRAEPAFLPGYRDPCRRDRQGACGLYRRDRGADGQRRG